MKDYRIIQHIGEGPVQPVLDFGKTSFPPWVILIILIALAGWLFWCILRINKKTEIERR